MSARANLAVLACLSLSACGFVRDKHIDGPYRLVAIDVDEQSSICYALKGGDCVGRIEETVFAVGFDASYIVAARHPSNDRSKTEYYYLIRALDGPLADPSVTVRGPFDAVAFDGERARLTLPKFTYEIASLK